MLPGDDRQPARLDAVLATSRAFGNFRFKDAAQTPGGAVENTEVGCETLKQPMENKWCLIR